MKNRLFKAKLSTLKKDYKLYKTLLNNHSLPNLSPHIDNLISEEDLIRIIHNGLELTYFKAVNLYKEGEKTLSKEDLKEIMDFRNSIIDIIGYKF